MRTQPPAPRIWRTHDEVALRVVAVQAVRAAYPDVLQKEIARTLNLTPTQVSNALRGTITCADDRVRAAFKTDLTNACKAMSENQTEAAAAGFELVAKKLREGRALVI